MLTDEERRGFMRLNAETEALITHLGTGATAVVKLVDLSASGCAFFTDMHLEPNQSFEFVVQGASERIEPLRRQALVVRVSPGKNHYLIAAEFHVETD